MGIMLEIKDLCVNYGVVPALQKVSFDVAEGEIVAIIGSNGAGKTTTMHAISGLVKPKSGQILFQGKNIAGTEAHKLVGQGICQVPEGRGIFLDLTVAENIALGSYLRKDKAEIVKDRLWVYDLFPRLAERRNQISGTLSGGEQQMLAMAKDINLYFFTFSPIKVAAMSSSFTMINAIPKPELLKAWVQVISLPGTGMLIPLSL